MYYICEIHTHTYVYAYMVIHTIRREANRPDGLRAPPPLDELGCRPRGMMASITILELQKTRRERESSTRVSCSSYSDLIDQLAVR
jgi:hypothetical protein